MTDETDNFPTVIGRPVFDTEPCPPGDYSHVIDAATENNLATYGLPASLGALRFPGGSVAIPEPTRAALLLGAKQWATAVRECWQDHFRDQNYFSDKLMKGKLDRLDAVLAELAAMEAK